MSPGSAGQGSASLGVHCTHCPVGNVWCESHGADACGGARRGFAKWFAAWAWAERAPCTMSIMTSLSSIGTVAPCGRSAAVRNWPARPAWSQVPHGSVSPAAKAAGKCWAGQQEDRALLASMFGLTGCSGTLSGPVRCTCKAWADWMGWQLSRPCGVPAGKKDGGLWTWTRGADGLA